MHFSGHELQKRRFSGPVRPQDCGMLAFPKRERTIGEDTGPAPIDSRPMNIDDGKHGLTGH
jgi:hypothetical protein